MIAILDDDYFTRRRLDDNRTSSKHEVFAEEHAIVERARGGIE